MKIFRKQYRVTLEEEELLVLAIAEKIKAEANIGSMAKAEVVVEKLLSSCITEEDLLSFNWVINFNLGFFKVLLGEIRMKNERKAKKKK